MIAKNKLSLLQTAVSNLVIVPPPEKVLVNNEVQKWLEHHGIVGESNWTPSGIAQGFKQEGITAIVALTSLLLKERADYQRGTSPARLARQVANKVISIFAKRPNVPLTLDDVELLEQDVAHLFATQTTPHTLFIPCSLIPEHAAAFTIGPVTFYSIKDLPNREHISLDNLEVDLTYGPLLRAMQERSAYWLGEITVTGFDETYASERANLAVDVALTAIQMIIPVSYSRHMARITGRTMPPWIGSVRKTNGLARFSIKVCHPGHGITGDVFDQIILPEQGLFESVGRRINAYINGTETMPKLNQSWSDAAYWLHEGLAEPLDAVSIATLETSIEVLLSAESSKNSAQRLRDAFRSFYGLSKDQPIISGTLRTVDQFIKSIVGARSRVLHGTMSTLIPDNTLPSHEHEGREVVELLAIDLLKRYTLMLDAYEVLQGAKDDLASFLHWITRHRN